MRRLDTCHHFCYQLRGIVKFNERRTNAVAEALTPTETPAVETRRKQARVALYRAGDKLTAVKSAYLRAYGWEETCATPGSLWLWRRDFSAEKYDVMTVPTEIAIYMTRTVLE
jgi:hypothetical protein